MGKPQKTKSVGGGRNDQRPNGKRWSKHSSKSATDHAGHRLTGRTKPTGKTVGGHKIVSGTDSSTQMVRNGHSVGEIRASRNTQYRTSLRHGRKAEARATAKKLRS